MATKQAVVDSLRLLQDSLSEIAKAIQTTSTVLLSPAVFGAKVDDAVQLWAESVEKEIVKFGVDGAVCAKYRDGLRKLHSLASKRNKKKSHQQAIKELQADFHADLIQPVMFHGGADPSEAIKQIIADIPYPHGSPGKADAFRPAAQGQLRRFPASGGLDFSQFCRRPLEAGCVPHAEVLKQEVLRQHD
jgi:hypothetical protein